MQRVRIGNAAEIVEISELPPHIILRYKRASRVRAQADGNTFPQRHSRALYDASQYDSRIIAVHGPDMGLLNIKERKRQDR